MTNSVAAGVGTPAFNDSNSLDSLPVGRVLPRVPGVDFGWQSNHTVYRNGLGSGNLARVVSGDRTGFVIGDVFQSFGGTYGLSRSLRRVQIAGCDFDFYFLADLPFGSRRLAE
jgi:hypothetical protein